MPLEDKYFQLITSVIPQAKEPAVLERLSLLYDRVVATNEKINITSLTSPIDVALKHILDSLTLFLNPVFCEAAVEGKWICDIGCGGGFPGLPLACVAPEISLTMIDSTEKKIVALKENAQHLSLSSVSPVWGRGEELAGMKGKHRERYDVCVSRAVASLPVLCELCLPFVKKDGYFFAMKGQKALEELEESRNAIPMLGGTLMAVQEIALDFSSVDSEAFSEEEKLKISEFASAKRYLIVIRKKRNTRPEYPRKWAQMTKKHL